MKHTHPLINLTAVLLFMVLYIPLLCVVLFSFNASRLGMQWGGFTLHWYVDLFHDGMVLRAAMNTIILAVSSTLISTVVGTVLAVGLQTAPWGKKARRFFEPLINLPVVTPDIIFAVALVIAFGVIRSLTGLFELGMPTMIVGHVTFQIAFVTLAVRNRLEAIGNEYSEAAFDLYASFGYSFRTVILPLLLPGILAGAMLAFTLSLDDFIISFFTAGPKSMTLPIFIYASVHRGVTPEIHALSTLVMVFTILVVVLLRRSEKHNEQTEAKS
ncbi:MAG: ABC transporter permease [Fibrobacteraceae bacterium]